jgi:protein-tyrosine phosphatase
LERAVPMLDDLARRLQDGRILLMHCGAGIGRAGTMAVGVLMRLGTAGGDALRMVSAARPNAGPEAGAQADLIAALSVLDGAPASNWQTFG